MPKTLGGLIDVFRENSFALIFIFLLGVQALPLSSTGSATTAGRRRHAEILR